MKLFLWSVLLISATAAADAPECTRSDRLNRVDGWPDVPTVERLYQPITPNGTVVCEAYPDQAQRENLIARFEEGRLDGAAYRVYYSSGRAVIQGTRQGELDAGGEEGNWALNCRAQSTGTGDVCTLRKADLWLEKDTAGHQRLGVGQNQRPGTEILVRVDSQWAVTAPQAAGFTEAQTAQLLNAMRDGKKVDTQFQKDGLSGVTEATLSLFGFNPARQIMDAVLHQLAHPHEHSAH